MEKQKKTSGPIELDLESGNLVDVVSILKKKLFLEKILMCCKFGDVKFLEKCFLI